MYIFKYKFTFKYILCVWGGGFPTTHWESAVVSQKIINQLCQQFNTGT